MWHSPRHIPTHRDDIFVVVGECSTGSHQNIAKFAIRRQQALCLGPVTPVKEPPATWRVYYKWLAQIKICFSTNKPQCLFYYILYYLFTSSSLPFPTRWGQQPEFLISKTFYPAHPPGWSAVPACPFGRNQSISLLVSPLVFFRAQSCQQLLSLHCFLQFSACVHISVVSFLWLSLWCYSFLAPFWFIYCFIYYNWYILFINPSNM